MVSETIILLLLAVPTRTTVKSNSGERLVSLTLLLYVIIHQAYLQKQHTFVLLNGRAVKWVAYCPRVVQASSAY